MPCSLIKGGTAKDAPALQAMARAATEAYLALAARAPRGAENLAGLRAFRERMLREGNPSSATMRRVLGAAGAERFFCEMATPLRQAARQRMTARTKHKKGRDLS